MAITALYENSATISTTEYSLPNNANYAAANVKTDDGVFQVFIHFNNLATSDEYEIKAYEKVRAAESVALIYYSRVVGAQGSPWITPSLVLMHGWDVTLKKIAGTDRAISWSVRQVT